MATCRYRCTLCRAAENTLGRTLDYPAMPTSVYEQLLELKSFATAVMSSAGSKIDEAVLAPCTELDEGELRAPKTSLKGWRMAVNDCIEMSSHWSTARVIAMDTALRKAGIVTLSEIRRCYSTRLAAV